MMHMVWSPKIESYPESIRKPIKLLRYFWFLYLACLIFSIFANKIKFNLPNYISWIFFCIYFLLSYDFVPFICIECWTEPRIFGIIRFIITVILLIIIFVLVYIIDLDLTNLIISICLWCFASATYLFLILLMLINKIMKRNDSNTVAVTI